MDKQEAIQRLERLTTELGSLNAVDASSPSFTKWRRNAEIAIGHVFGTDTRHLPDFESVRYTPCCYSMDNPDPEFRRAFRDGVQTVNALIHSMIEEIQEYWPDEGLSPSQHAAACSPTSNRVFLVHGHNEARKEGVARFLAKLKLEPIILHEQADQGRTIIEKLLHYADVAYAVVLLTGDDRGGAKSAPVKNQCPRARQNVIFELGFFLGHLGRGCVCPLYEEGVELPSDYDGVVYVPLDQAGAWQVLLARELRQAGLPVDMNDIA